MNDAALQTLQLSVRGMTCAACVGRVERALRKVPGVAVAEVNFATETASVTWGAGDHLSDMALLDAVANAGYEAHVQAVDAPLADEQQGWWDVWGAVTLGLMASVPLVLPMLWGDHHVWPAWLQFALATPVQFILGARFYRAGWAALKDRSGNMDQLVALGTTAAWALSCWLWWSHARMADQGHGHGMPDLYFESSAVVITLVLLGKALEARAKRQTTAAIRALQALRPDTVLRLGPQGEVSVPLAQVVVGDTLVVRPGERVPADGVVTEGGSHVDESMLTGEPLPIAKALGERLTGGSINGEGRLLMRVAAIGGQTVLSGIIRSVVEAQAGKAPIQRVVDRVSAVFVPTVLVLALLTGLGWWLWGLGVEQALVRAVAVLVIACPCALGLATPAALMAGTGAAARQGILIKDPEALETAHRISVVAFDKTGTLTVGQPRLVHWQVRDGLGLDAQRVLQVAAAMQSGSEHPLARAVVAACAQGTEGIKASAVRAVPGKGLEAVVTGEGDGLQAPWSGRGWRLGSTRWMASLVEPEGRPADLMARAHELAAGGASVSWLMCGDADGLSEAFDGAAGAWQLIALLGFGDELKPQAAQAVAQLHALGIDTVMISGDNRGAADAVGKALGIRQVVAEVLPADKAAQVQALKKGERGTARVVAMVGDGINDAPALAAADVGMAMANPHGATDVALHAAGVTLMRGDPLLVPAAVDISRRTSAKIRQNLFWAFGYNVIGIPLAMAGGLSPMLAGAAMAFSSVSVVGNALLLSRWHAKGSRPEPVQSH